ncbi:hypothetical protein QYF61_014720 [Mycteria americana]|uniref:Uncharacterized protein n=1 Tax=Mycteria americana TaxID=33587 RepID=A0AAN7NGU1_MYCAM|nr:hypothetical protein QYF61_014720 [Mycteria americana]
MRPSNQFLIHQTVHPSNPYLSNLERRTFSSCALAFLTPSLHNQAASLYSSQDTCPCFHCLCISFSPFSLTSGSRLSHAGFLPSFPDFLCQGIESFCTLWKASLKICQLCSAPLSLRAVSQGVLLTNSLNSWNFAVLKFKVLTLLFTRSISLRTANRKEKASYELVYPADIVLMIWRSTLHIVSNDKHIHFTPRVAALPQEKQYNRQDSQHWAALGIAPPQVLRQLVRDEMNTKGQILVPLNCAPQLHGFAQPSSSSHIHRTTLAWWAATGPRQHHVSDSNGDVPGLADGQGIAAASVLLHWTGWNSSVNSSQRDCDLWVHLEASVVVYEVMLEHLKACGYGSAHDRAGTPLEGLQPWETPGPTEDKPYKKQCKCSSDQA